jgi:flagellar basal-body rod modification protein FlgD
MVIPGVNSIGENTQTQTYGKQTLKQADFMHILLTELSHQDPTNPMDSKEFTVQLTQFSSLEALENMNGTMEDLLAYQQSMQNATVTNLIGKSVKVSGNGAYLNGTAEMDFNLDDDAVSSRIIIKNEAGMVVRSDDLEAQNAGSGSYVWDGQNDLGEDMPMGNYTFDVEALDIEGNPVNVTTKSLGRVTDIAFEDGMTYLVLDGSKRVFLSDIESVGL